MNANLPRAAQILSVEDDPVAARLVKTVLEKQGYQVDCRATGEDFRAALGGARPDLCLLDLHLPDCHGLDLLKHLRAVGADVPAIVITASEAVEDVVTAMKLGASDYISKPFDVQRLIVSVRNALQLARQRTEIDRLRQDVEDAHAPEHLVGSSPVMAKLRDLIRRAAGSEVEVLVLGESGAGKELVARALHYASPRRQGPFVDVNCAALTDTLLESELFGHEKGAFTGADSRRRGRFEQADGGTLFLDEIGDMPAATQAKILRVLQERRFQRVGGEERLEVNVRVVCATNRNLEEAVEKGAFRRDLFYRINTLTLELPPLRERTSDIPELARHFLHRACRREKRAYLKIGAPAMDRLVAHAWPGNVRELAHAMDRAALVCEGEEVLPEHLPPAIARRAASAPAEPAGGSLIEVLEQTERAMIVAALERTGWVKARAARELGITERVISYKMQNLGIDRTV